jgi:ParB family chromosome partitioning protein
VAKLAFRFGKSETYIHNRMRLNELTGDLLNLVNENVLSLSVALELCRYSKKTQTLIYEKHLQNNSDSFYNDWNNLTSREFIKRLENCYCADLSRYRFDKSHCTGCPFNTDCYSLFPEESKEGKCTNLTCLTERNRHYLVDACKNIVAEHPDLDICRSSRHNGGYEDIYADLSGQGFSIDETPVRTFPHAPETPGREEYKGEAGYEEARDKYYSEMAEYKSDMEKIEQMLNTGKAKRIVTIRDNAPAIGYFYLTEDGAATGEKKETATPAEKLEKQDRRNKEIAVEKIVEDTKQLIRKTEIPQSDFTEFEDKLLYFAMLDDLKSEHFALFLENVQDKWHLTEGDKIAIINSLTEEQKTLVRRDYLVKHMSDTYGTAKKSCLMLEFARLHFPEEVAETETGYNEVYIKRHERIAERLEAINRVEVREEREAQVQGVE